MNTIYILWIRQLKRYVRSKSRMFGSLGQPVLFLVALGFGFGPIYEKAGGGNYIQFLGPGVIAMGIIFTAIFGGIELIWDRQFGFLKETLVAPVSRTNIMLGRTLGGATVAALQGVLVFILTLVVGFRPDNWLLLPVALVVAFLTALVFTALGTAIAVRLTDMQAFPLIMNFVVMPLFFLSGSIFPLAGLGGGISTAANLDPLSYGVDGIRYALTGQTHFGLGMDFAVLSIIAALLIALGSYLFSGIEV